ncbi:trypsin-like serine protease [Paucilactobacillus oligofermentans DSM 15707 = LMG 22743]|uniref:Trypsin-like serine protease n=1 Tax=Paucilactobacillus oligofermentans DSM 15707 = LMG 22743 TaxID=1423778 RepID=A0A0R1RFA2_9LACO|nr:trypsin-like peptidase domain-containing protein [Paucilactobacillus oligofermentans]KRL55677.1 trypsin-like serine protease [Paucilactobacillus oligofermentans DSM 15707 = LMG 22743]CUS25333.1 Serine protease Do-like HtrA [Paucilactobacillus oligofermentans DSM 15707 = LMG 22743]
MQNNNDGETPKKKKRFKLNLWWIVGLIGLFAGLVGGGAAYEIGSLLTNGHVSSLLSVPSSSNKKGGTKVNQSKVTGTSQSTKAYKSVKAAVVSVENLQAEASSSNSLYTTDSSSSSSDSSLEAASEGSGVIYKKDGNTAYIVTNNHVVTGSSAIQVILSNGKKVTATIVGTDSATDLAVLKISSKNVTAVASFANSNEIDAGQTVLAIGSPLGSQYASSVTQGIISAKKRTVQVQDNSGNTTGNATVIQTDTAINPGNSGGPLINLAGQVVGINSMKLTTDDSGTSVEGMGFSIPSNEVVSVINKLVKDGKITRPALGISLVSLDQVTSAQQASVLKLPTSITSGIVVMSILSPSAAGNAGLEKYDVITKLDGKKVTDEASLKDVLYDHKVGDSVAVTYYHNGDKQTATIKLSESTSSLSSSDSSSS